MRMIISRSSPLVLLVLILIGVTGCNTVQRVEPTFGKLQPYSILIIPPMNNSVEVAAPYIYLSTITKPVAEKGYYVFPVAVIDHFLKENGLPTPAEMNSIPLDKIKEHIGADAVLYATIDNWGQKYQVISSTTVVNVKLKLVDVDTGAVLWQSTASATAQGNSGGSSLEAKLIGAIVNQIASSISDQTPELARAANDKAINHPSRGLPKGLYRLRAEAAAAKK